MKILPIFVADEAAGGAAAADGGGGGGAAAAAAAAAANYQLHCLAYHSANLLTPSTQVKIFSIPNQYSSKIPPTKEKTKNRKSRILISKSMLLFSFFCNSAASSCSACFSREREKKRLMKRRAKKSLNKKKKNYLFFPLAGSGLGLLTRTKSLWGFLLSD